MGFRTNAIDDDTNPPGATPRVTVLSVPGMDSSPSGAIHGCGTSYCPDRAAQSDRSDSIRQRTGRQFSQLPYLDREQPPILRFSLNRQRIATSREGCQVPLFRDASIPVHERRHRAGG
jgi:hypothetical protein